MAGDATVALYSRRLGEGPPLIAVHGLFGSGGNLGGVARLLSDQFTVHLLDVRNHGRSPHSPRMSYPLMAADLVAWMAAEGIDQAPVFGHSMGGKIAMQAALDYPNRVRGLIIADIAPSAYAPHHQAIFHGLQALPLEQLESRLQADQLLAEQVADPGVRQFLLKNLVGDVRRGFRWQINLPALQACYAQLLSAIDGEPYPGPVLFLKGGLSGYLKQAHQPLIESLFPRSRLKIILNAGHWLHADNPRLTAAVSRKFLQQNCPSGSSV